MSSAISEDESAESKNGGAGAYAPAPPPAQQPQAPRTVGFTWRRVVGLGGPHSVLRPLVALVAVSAVLALVSPEFFSLSNLHNVADQSAVPVVAAVGLTFVLLMGAIDLSIEGVIGATAMLMVLLVLNDQTRFQLGMLAVPVVVVAGGAFGLLSGLATTKLRIPSFMVTLGTWSIGLGVAQFLFGNGAPKMQDVVVRSWALNTSFGFSRISFVALACVALGYIAQRYTRFGRYAFAIGGGEEVVHLSGLRVNRYKLYAFVVAGAAAGLAGAMLAARLGQGAVNSGSGMLFLTLAGCVIGGTLLSGGRGGVLHSALGVLTLTVLADGMVLLGAGPYVQQAVEGAVVVAVVAATNWRSRARLRIVP